MKIQELNAEERVLKTINFEEPDKVPAFESTFTNNAIKRYYGTPIGTGLGITLKKLFKMGKAGIKLLKSGLKNKTLLRKMYRTGYEFSYKIKLDLVLSAASLYPRKIIEEGDGFIDEYGRIMKFETYTDKNGISTSIAGYYGGFFKNIEEYESWEQPDPNDKTRLVHYQIGREIQKEMNDRVFSIPSVGALMECTWEGFGLENFSRLLASQKHAKKVFDDRGKFTLEVVKIMAEHDAKIVLLWDDYGFKNGLFMSPMNYRRYVLPWIRKICKAAHRQDCKIMLHSDGDLLEIFQDIVDCGVDIINPIESTTANPEYDIFKLHKKYSNKITFCGNLSPVLLATGPISKIEAYAKKLIKELAPSGGYIYSSGHSINPAIPVENFEVMKNTKEKYGIYPININ